MENGEIDKYRNGFIDGYNAFSAFKNNNLSTVTLYGYTLDQILNMIKKKEMSEIEEPKLMTREEAIEKIKYVGFLNANDICNALEALGLIKFKERELFKIDEWNAVRFLKSLGYTVRKNG